MESAVCDFGVLGLFESHKRSKVSSVRPRNEDGDSRGRSTPGEGRHSLQGSFPPVTRMHRGPQVRMVLRLGGTLVMLLDIYIPGMTRTFFSHVNR